MWRDWPVPADARDAAGQRPHLTPALSSRGEERERKPVPPSFPLLLGGGGQGEVGRRSNLDVPSKGVPQTQRRARP